jgi:hypothetical protein
MLQAGEKGSLPEKIEQNYRRENDREFFLLPCLYFREKCTIYDQKRARVCSGYRCQLLIDFAEGIISLSEALETVRGARALRTRVLDRYRSLSGNTVDISFRQLLSELGKMQKNANEQEEAGKELEVFQAVSNIFEALLIKHFRSAGDFDKMMIAREDKRQKSQYKRNSL